MEWHLLRTGRVWVDPGGPFGLVPKALWQKILNPNENDLVPMDLNCLLVHSDGKIIVVDTGLGDKLTAKAKKNWGIAYPHGTMLENLDKHGISPADVDLVIDTHLHWDHCGGNTSIVDGNIVPTFPNATYYVQYMEWAEASHPDARTRGTYLLENYLPVWEAERFQFLYGDTEITSEVKCVLTRGHTRGHQSVLLDDGEKPVLYLADLSSYAVHFTRSAWMTAYDVEPLETIATKKKWKKWALVNEATLIFEHDTQTSVGQLKKDQAGKLYIEEDEL